MPAPSYAIEGLRRRLRDIASNDSSIFVEDVDPTLDLAVERAVVEYSRDMPDELVVDLPGAGSPYFAHSGITGWVDQFSRVARVEYPAAAVSATHRPVLLDVQTDVKEYRDTTGRYLWLLYHTPVAGETVRLTFTVPRSLTEAADTIRPQDLEPVLDLAASYACLMLATEASTIADPVLRSDSTNYRDAQLRLRQQAEDWRAAYERHMGKGEDQRTRPAAAFSDFDAAPRRGEAGRPVRYWLTHGRRR